MSNIHFVNQYKNELNEEIEQHRMKGLTTQLTIFMLFNCYRALLCDKAFCKSLKQEFRTKCNILKSMNNDLINE